MTREEMITTHDGIKLRLFRDIPEGTPKAVVVWSHGLAAHANALGTAPQFLADRGIAVYRHDQRGHGKSEGKRGYVKSHFEVVEDLLGIVRLAKAENPGLKVYLIGHSWGGHCAALFGHKYPGEVDGIILCAALTRYYRMIHGLLPWPGDPESYVSSLDAVNKCLNIPLEFDMNAMSEVEVDPLMLMEVSVSLINAYQEGFRYLKENVNRFTDPVLLVGGNSDDYVSPRDSVDFYLTVPSRDKSLFIMGQYDHMLYQNPWDVDELMGVIASWIEKRASGSVVIKDRFEDGYMYNICH